MSEPLIFAIQGNAADDGPGIRSVVFLKGCPLTCPWCHNPEGRSPSAELSWADATCIGDDACVAVCGPSALSAHTPGRVDRDRCTTCGSCVPVCPTGALEIVGEALTVDEVAARVLRDKPFYDASGGGVTLSGGEPTVHLDYVARLARRLREAGVHVLLETSGAFAWERFERLLLPHLDAVFFDLKLIDATRHRAVCGVDNHRVLANFDRLLDAAAAGRPELTPRVPLVPGYTATAENLSGIAAFLRARGVTRVVLLPYNPLFFDKAGKLGGRSDAGLSRRWMEEDDVERCRTLFRQLGIDPA